MDMGDGGRDIVGVGDVDGGDTGLGGWRCVI